jgi:hypothetical protein
MSAQIEKTSAASPGTSKMAHRSATKVDKRSNLTDEQAIALVEKLPAVKAWKLGCQRNGAQAKKVTLHVALDRKEGGTYFVHVYEEVPDDGASSHTATFNWYDVDEKTGKIKPEF